tara:strand:- start:6381 stop:7172 length:792 start_codon:yes stop_codon:yes gene_type:complete
MAKLKTILITTGAILATAVAAWALLRDGGKALGPLTNPGPLSQAHAFLGDNCAACHTPMRGVEDANCVVCHANATSILKRQPTAFHADIGNCAECHQEHRHPPARLSEMDHKLVAEIGLGQLKKADPESEAAATAQLVRHWIMSGQAGAVVPPTEPDMHPMERMLNCAACHSRDDRHFQLFGNDCAFCHGVKKWTISEFQHPSPSSRDCAQCHMAPPSHYMMHFKMISARVAGKPHADVSQCFLCHQTTSWNDILGKGWYKHH